MTLTPDDLERLVDRALAELPTPRAPRSLRPRVLAAVEPVPIVGRPWFTWPWPLQAAAVLGAVALALGLAGPSDRIEAGAPWQIWLVAAILVPPLWLACRWMVRLKRRAAWPGLSYL